MNQSILASDGKAPNREHVRIKLWAKVGLTVVALVALGFLGRRYFDEIYRLKDANYACVMAMIFVFVVERLLAADILRRSLAGLRHQIGLGEAFWLTVLRGYTSLLIPRSGFGAVAAYLKLRHGVDLARYGALVLPLTLLQCSIVGAMGIAGMLLVHFRYSAKLSWPLLMVFASCVLISIIAWAIRPSVPSHWNGRIAEGVRRLGGAWRLLIVTPGLMFQLAIRHVLLILIRATRLLLAFWALGLSVNAAGVLVASLLADVAFFVGVTPNALGLREAAVVYGARSIGVSRSAALATAVLDRIVTTLVIIAAAQIAIWKLGRRQPDTP